ncbi:MAG: DNA-binding protein [Candidatus Schekmanbacteria bacterium]|nr:DNA-binding protein [Candidatus Schekmanbacteria bacterium]
MRKIFILIALISALTLITSTASFAQHKPGSVGWSPLSNYGKIYNPKTVETISGVVEKVEKITPMEGMTLGIQILLKTDKEIVPVHLGPAWYIENQDYAIEPGDKIEVKGSKCTFQGKPSIMAAEVKKGDKIMKVRDEKGFPFWCCWQ